jgi:hypothetical protein
MKKITFKSLILTLILILSIPAVAFADSDHHEKSKLIVQYGPDGGITFSLVADLFTSLQYDDSSDPVYQYEKADVSIASQNEYQIVSCGTQFNVRDYAVVDGFNVDLNYDGTYIVPPGTTIVGKHSGNDWSMFISAPFSFTVESEGYAKPTPSKCFGGGSVSDSWTVNL